MVQRVAVGSECAPVPAPRSNPSPRPADRIGAHLLRGGRSGGAGTVRRADRPGRAPAPADTAADHAAIELRVRVVGGTDTPLVGPYSRFGWSHPGPFLFDLLALPYRGLGREGTGLLSGAAVVNAVAVIVAVGVLAAAARSRALVWCDRPRAARYTRLGGKLLDDPWNPYIIVLPMFTLAVLAVRGERGPLDAAVRACFRFVPRPVARRDRWSCALYYS